MVLESTRLRDRDLVAALLSRLEAREEPMLMPKVVAEAAERNAERVADLRSHSSLPFHEVMGETRTARAARRTRVRPDEGEIGSRANGI